MRTPGPWRVLFPLGALFAVGGAAPWILFGTGVGAYPAVLHRSLMMQGFETCFVLGFLLTSVPAFTHGAPCRGWELAGATLGPLLFGAFTLAGADAAAQAAFTLTLAWLAVALGRRVVGAALPPPEEFAFVGVGLLFGLIGGVTQCAAALGLGVEPAPRFGIRLVSLGMTLALVLGVGTMLVPVFAGMRDPLVLPGIAGPHDRPRRRTFYLVVAAALAGAFALEAAGRATAAAWLRFAAALALGLLGWKLGRLPGRRALVSFALWGAGWAIVLGLGLAAAFPRYEVAFHHFVYLGGFGVLTAAIAARVITGHGRHPVTDEARMVTPGVLAALAAALAARLAAEFLPGRLALLAASAACWILAWALWSFGAFPRIARAQEAPSAPPAHPKPSPDR